MKLFEYQAKELFRDSGIPVPASRLIRNKNELPEALKTTGMPCMVKAQVLQGGRGKAGLIKSASTAEEAANAAKELFAHDAPTILIEEAINFTQEFYLSITLDPLAAQGLIIASSEGGVEIESLAKESPASILREGFDLDRGLESFRARSVAYDMGLEGKTAKQAADLLLKLYGLFSHNDAELVEINPLFVTSEGDLIAGDAKIRIDDNAAFRQKRYELNRDHFDSDLEYEAALDGIPYLQFDGEIGLMCAGAGLTTTIYDLIHYEGGSVANYLEFGGPNYRRAMRAMELCLKNPSKVILIVTFGTIARADVMAEGVVEAIRDLHPDRPIVTCIRGTNEDKAIEILKGAGLEPLFDTEEAVRKAVALSQGGKV